MTEQRTTEWYKQRLGKITASEVAVIMKNKRGKVADGELPFADAAYTYLDGKIMENYLPIHETDQLSQNIVEDYIEQHSYASRAAEWGVLNEDYARERYAEEMGVEILQVGFIPYEKYPKLAGGSPDGLVREERGGIEIKCPYTLEKHLQHLLYEAPSDLKSGEPDYYWQCVMNMLITGCDYWDFVSYNPYVYSGKQLKVLRIMRDNDEIKTLEDRIELAVSYIKGQMAKLDNAQMIITK